jgi:cytochrome c biogenesis protein ResB
MELLVIVLVLVYSVWSEVNKAKKDENVDIDFSELSSLDDFFKNTGSQPAQKVSTPSGASKKPAQQRSKKQPAAKRDAVNYDDLPGLTGQVNRDRSLQVWSTMIATQPLLKMSEVMSSAKKLKKCSRLARNLHRNIRHR